MRNKHFMSVATVVGAVLGFSALGQAATVTLNSTDTLGNSSFNSAGNWSNAAAPSAANDYVVGVQWLRTPNAAAFNGAFAGNSLTINSTGGLLYKSTGASTFTFNNLILNGGLVRSGSGFADTWDLAGKITVTGTGSQILADQSSVIIDAPITGTGGLLIASTNANAYSTTLNGVSTYTGNLSYSATAATTPFTFSATSGWKFAIGASGVNNSITVATGSNAVTPVAFNGAFNIDTTAAAATAGSSWTLIGPGFTPTYGATFSIPGYTQTGTVWSNGAYAYSQTTGVLSVVPEPTSLAAISLIGLAGLTRRRR